jgi:AcrR family transcriptional regulator
MSTSSIPRRRKAASTRELLVAAAAEAFDRDGFHGTDSNRIARAAGYATGTFYKHFADKRAVFLVVLERQAEGDLEELRALASERRPPAEMASSLVSLLIEHRQAARGLRANAQMLAATDAQVQAALQRHRSELLDVLRLLRGSASREAGALLLWMIERAGDALADGEARGLHLSRTALLAELERAVDRRLRGR